MIVVVDEAGDGAFQFPRSVVRSSFTTFFIER